MSELYEIAEWVTSDGLLRTDEQMIREIFDFLPFQRMGEQIRKRLMTVAQGMRFCTSLRNSAA
jgi:hypothetical protein